MPVALSWILLANAGNRLLTVTTQLMVGFLLVPEQVGIFAVAASLAGLASPFQSGDHARLALQDGAAAPATAAVLRNWLLLGSFAGCVLALAVLPILGLAVAIAPLACLLPLALLRVMANVRVTLLSRDGRSAAIAAAYVSEGGARSLALIGAALLGAGMWSLVAGEVAAVLVSAALLSRLESRPFPGGWRLPAGLLRRLLMTLGVSLLVGVEVNCAALAIGQLVGTAAAGSFAFANRIAGQIGVLVLPLILLESLPRLLAARDDSASFRSASRREVRRMILIIAPLAGLLLAAGPLALVLLWGERWREAAGLLAWLAPTIGLRLGYALAKAHLESLAAFPRILQLSALDTMLILAAVLLGGASGDVTYVVMALGCEALLILLVAVAVVARTMRRQSLEQS
jgi:O-antigen/teichoic acid export membrane protein